MKREQLTAMSSELIRKEAAKAGIKNYTKFKKVELIEMLADKEEEAEVQEVQNNVTEVKEEENIAPETQPEVEETQPAETTEEEHTPETHPEEFEDEKQVENDNIEEEKQAESESQKPRYKDPVKANGWSSEVEASAVADKVIPEEFIGKNKSETVRNLLKAGWARQSVAAVVGIRYQHVREIHIRMLNKEAATAEQAELEAFKKEREARLAEQKENKDAE